MKKALITGITGQDGAYLAEFLLEKGYEVHGIMRRSSSFNTARIDHLTFNPNIGGKRFFTYYGDMGDSSNLNRLMRTIQPEEVYNLAAQSHVRVSFEVPEYTADINALGTLRLLDAIRDSETNTKFYQASTSELFGLNDNTMQDENTPFYPRSPYGVAKLFAYWIVVNYREAYNMFACNGILFNHESPIRGETFVTKKITQAVARISLGKQDILYLGNLDSKRDWGYAKDYVEVMWMILQQDKPDDYVCATGKTHTIREFCEKAFKYVGITLDWRGKGINEEGLDTKTGNILIKIDPRYFRPTEVDYLCGNPDKLKRHLGWEPKTNLQELISIMMDADLNKIKEHRD